MTRVPFGQVIARSAWVVKWRRVAPELDGQFAADGREYAETYAEACKILSEELWLSLIIDPHVADEDHIRRAIARVKIGHLMKYYVPGLRVWTRVMDRDYSQTKPLVTIHWIERAK